jgi:hypothetical protein
MVVNFHKFEQSNWFSNYCSFVFCNIRFCIVLLKKAKTSLGWIVGSRLTWSAHKINRCAHGNICIHTLIFLSFGQIAREKLTKDYEGNLINFMSWNWSLCILMWALLVDIVVMLWWVFCKFMWIYSPGTQLPYYTQGASDLKRLRSWLL